MYQKYKYRTHNLAYARNKLLSYAKKNFKQMKKCLIMDMDDVNSYMDISELVNLITNSNNKYNVMCANQKNFYYDRWALRSIELNKMKPQCLNENWNECTNLQHFFPEINNPEKQTFNLDEKPIEVSSCFGGMAIYDMDYLLKYNCQYRGTCLQDQPCGSNGQEECEHVPFHNCIISNGGKIAILPRLLNQREESTDNPAIISSIGILDNPYIFYWDSSYKNFSTEYRVPQGYFKKNWNPKASLVWVRLGSLKVNNKYDLITFSKEILPLLNAPIVLITGDGDLDVINTLPVITKKILEHPMIICWYTQNCTSVHSKLKPLPIGISMHNYSKSEQLLFHQTCNYLNAKKKSFQIILDAHLTHSHSSRVHLEEKFKNNSNVIIINNRLSRDELFQKYKKADFVLCPRGNGFDTHRFWEAICFGCIPIVQDSQFAQITYKDMPVVLSRDFVKDINNIEKMNDYIKKYGKLVSECGKSICLEHIWMSKIFYDYYSFTSKLPELIRYKTKINKQSNYKWIIILIVIIALINLYMIYRIYNYHHN